MRYTLIVIGRRKSEEKNNEFNNIIPNGHGPSLTVTSSRAIKPFVFDPTTLSNASYKKKSKQDRFIRSFLLLLS